MEKLVEIKKRPPRFPVDIIIPFHGQYESLIRTYIAIQNYTPNQNYNVILVDDGSPNSGFVKDITKGKKRTIGISLPYCRGFGGAVMAGIQAARTDHIVIMHSDARPQNIYWLYNLQNCLTNHKSNGVKLISSRVTNPGTSSNYPDKWVYTGDETEEELVIADKAIPLVCVLFHKKLLNTVGPIKEYPYGWFEDEEFAFRMGKNKFKQGICMKSVVDHDGGKTINAMVAGNPVVMDIMKDNGIRCVKDMKN